jgi:hypothetical protein
LVALLTEFEFLDSLLEETQEQPPIFDSLFQTLDWAKDRRAELLKGNDQ